VTNPAVALPRAADATPGGWGGWGWGVGVVGGGGGWVGGGPTFFFVGNAGGGKADGARHAVFTIPAHHLPAKSRGAGAGEGSMSGLSPKRG